MTDTIDDAREGGVNAEAKHTPGPWDWRRARTMMYLSSLNYGSLYISMPAPGNKNYFSHGDDIRVANARLIAAAPDLLESLNGCLDLIRRAQETLCTYLHPDSPHDDRETLNILLEMFDGPKQREIEGAARVAIAKAVQP